jgi:hypothetical protein
MGQDIVLPHPSPPALKRGGKRKSSFPLTGKGRGQEAEGSYAFCLLSSEIKMRVVGVAPTKKKMFFQDA